MNKIEQIKMRYPYERTQIIADDLGMTYSQVANRAFSMGLKKSDEFKKSNQSGRYNLIKAGEKFRFKPGHVPKNKGKKIEEKHYDKLKKTMFKKGNRPHNWKPDGSIVERTDSSGRTYLHYKISDSNWIHYHVKIWMDHNGDIPDNHIIRFKDGNTLNCDINNLELISRAENATRNSIQRFPDELKNLIRLQSKLIKKIDKNGKK